MRFLLLFFVVSANAANFDAFTKAIATVESNNNPRAYNRKENAIGIYQIRAAYFADAQKQDKELARFKHADCYNPMVAKRVVWAYFKRYEPDALRKQDWQTLAKLHNGGSGHRVKSGQTRQNLEIYWEKVKKHLTLGR